MRLPYAERDEGFETRCWLWEGATNGATQRGYVQVAGKARLVHRLSYEEEHGPLDSKQHLHHRCEVPLCIRPDHLEPMTNAEHRSLHGKTQRRDPRGFWSRA